MLLARLPIALGLRGGRWRMSGGRRLRSVVTQRLLIVAASALMVLGAGCSASAPAPHVSEAAADRASPVVIHRHLVAASGDIVLSFAGDVHFAGRVARLLEDPTTTFGPITSVLKSADFTAVNLEPPVPSRGQPQPKTYHFATTPGAFTALRDAGVDLVTMANNHILDYGHTGLANTLAAAEAAHFPFVGRGSQRGGGLGALRNDDQRHEDRDHWRIPGGRAGLVLGGHGIPAGRGQRDQPGPDARGCPGRETARPPRRCVSALGGGKGGLPRPKPTVARAG